MDFINIVSIGIIGLVTGSVFMTKQIQSLKARAKFDSGKIKGYVVFEQEPNTRNVTIQVNLSGFEPNTSHGFHIHEKPIEPGDSCDKAGPHFDPNNSSPHGGPHDGPKARHVGDLGNILSDANGNVQVKFSDYLIELTGQDSIVGRTLVIHESADDLKTIESSGKRIACAIIASSDN
jgi:Cu-Zn family superoxide dismutase